MTQTYVLTKQHYDMLPGTVVYMVRESVEPNYYVVSLNVDSTDLRVVPMNKMEFVK